MINWTKHAIRTKRDPEREYQRMAIDWLNKANEARIAYDETLQKARLDYGEPHTPTKIAGVQSPCLICTARGIVHMEHEQLNHQTGQIISGIYSDHFPTPMKDRLRACLADLNLYLRNAVALWRQSGRRKATFEPLRWQAHCLPDGRYSYY